VLQISIKKTLKKDKMKRYKQKLGYIKWELVFRDFWRQKFQEYISNVIVTHFEGLVCLEFELPNLV
jgi:hypothetical protein